MNFPILQMTEDEIKAQLNGELTDLAEDGFPVVVDKIEAVSEELCRRFVRAMGDHYSNIADFQTTEDWLTEETFVVREFLVSEGFLPNDGTYEEGGA